MQFKQYLNPIVSKNFDKLNDAYQSAEPFKHIVIDDFLKEEVANELAKLFPKFSDNFWYEYNNPIEKKLASDDIRKFPPLLAKVIHALNSQDFLKKIEKLTSIKKLFSDPYLHGGGLHCSKRGGKLDIHVDYSIHPKLQMERRINLILYMTPNWQEEWGGFFEMWNNNISKCEKKVMPKFNRAVIFNTDDSSLHGHPDPLTCPENISRNSIALYYLTEPRKNASLRPRARFFKRPGDPDDVLLEEFRKKRSEVSGVY
jgi:Rps23 Pro-64 3,4-dihydroxylase Tpa1-like proline 4-hydroxylase